MPHLCTNCDRTFADGSKEMLSGCPDCGGNKFQFAPSVALTETADSGGAGATANEPPDSTPRPGEPAEPRPSDPTDADTREEPSTSGDGVARERTEAVRERATGTESRSERPQPSADERTANASRSEPKREFSEWPDTARRPEDRSSTSSRATSRTDSSGGDGSSVADNVSDGHGSHSAGDPPTADQSDDSENSAQADARSAVVTPDELPAQPKPTAEPPDHGRVVSEPSEPDERPSLEDLRQELNDQFESIKILSPGQYELNLMELYDREEYIVSLQEDGRYVIDVPDSWRDSDE